MAPLYRLPWKKGLAQLHLRLLSTLYPPLCLLCGAAGQQIDGEAIDICEACQQALRHNVPCCARCGIPLTMDATVCGSCLNKVPPFDSLFAPFLYQDGIRELLLALKFGHKLAHARLLGALMADRLAGHLAEHGCPPEVIVPVPLHPKRQRERGYNQALELLRLPARRHGIAIDHQLVRRRAATAKQTNLSAAERRRNLKGAFVVGEGLQIPRHLVIFDDVVTTGTTVTELARTLKQAGAERVDVWAVARVPKPGD